MPKRLTKTQRAAIVAAYLANVPAETIAERYGVHKSYPGMLAQRRGHEKRPQTRFSTGRPPKKPVKSG